MLIGGKQFARAGYCAPICAGFPRMASGLLVRATKWHGSGLGICVEDVDKKLGGGEVILVASEWYPRRCLGGYARRKGGLELAQASSAVFSYAALVAGVPVGGRRDRTGERRTKGNQRKADEGETRRANGKPESLRREPEDVR